MNHPAITELNRLDSKLNSTPAQNYQNRQNSSFPIDSFPPVMRSIIEESAKASQVPFSMSGMVALSSISTAVGGGIQIKSTHGRVLHGNIHVLVVAKSGTGKGSAYGAIASPLIEYNSELIEHWRTQQLPKMLSEQAILNEKMRREKALIAKGEGSSDAFHEMARDLSLIEE